MDVSRSSGIAEAFAGLQQLIAEIQAAAPGKGQFHAGISGRSPASGFAHGNAGDHLGWRGVVQALDSVAAGGQKAVGQQLCARCEREDLASAGELGSEFGIREYQSGERRTGDLPRKDFAERRATDCISAGIGKFRSARR